jgi:hypothetical protein
VAEPLLARAALFVRALPDHAVVDRLVRGRGWIPVLALMLSVIVAMQVSLLRLGAGIGRSIERSSALQAQNEQLRARVGTLADDQRIERLAATMGMLMPAPTGVTFLSAHSSSTPQAAAQAITAPDPAGFSARQQASAASTATSAGASTGALGAAAAAVIGANPALGSLGNVASSSGSGLTATSAAQGASGGSATSVGQGGGTGSSDSGGSAASTGTGATAATGAAVTSAASLSSSTTTGG